MVGVGVSRLRGPVERAGLALLFRWARFAVRDGGEDPLDPFLAPGLPFRTLAEIDQHLQLAAVLVAGLQQQRQRYS